MSFALQCPVCGVSEIGHQCLGPNHKFMIAEKRPEITEIDIMRVVDHIREKGGVGIEVTTAGRVYILMLFEYDEL